MLNKRYYIALGIVVVMTLFLLKLPQRAAHQVKRGVAGFFLPLFCLQASAAHFSDKAATAVTSKAELARQLEQAERQNQELRIQLSQADELTRENARLRQYFGFAKQLPWKTKVGRVIGRDPVNWWKTLRIDVGRRDGIVPNLAVVVPQNSNTNQWPVICLVGRIGDVTDTQSQVVLLGNPDCRVSVFVEMNNLREAGVIAPASPVPVDSSIVELSFLSRNSKLSPGQRVVTSGEGGIFPKGIFVGQVVDWKTVGYGLYNEARVKIDVKPSSLEEVWVKLP